MGHPLRHLSPNTEYFVTVNCAERRFFLRPDAEVTEWIAYWLARANRRFPKIAIEGVVAMSSHLHLLLLDRGSSLSAFMAYFTGNLAKAVNRQRGRQGRVFDRRFTSAPVLDDTAQADRLAYLIDNPIKAGLVERWEDWPGLLLWSPDGQWVTRPVRAFDRTGYERAVADTRRGKPKPRREDYEKEETLHVFPAQPREEHDVSLSDRAASLMKDVRARQHEHSTRRRQKGESVLGAKRLRTQDWRAAPAQPKHSPRPICHAGTEQRWREFARGLRSLRNAYIEASVAFRAGDYGIEFPDYTFRPPGGFSDVSLCCSVAA